MWLSEPYTSWSMYMLCAPSGPLRNMFARSVGTVKHIDECVAYNISSVEAGIFPELSTIAHEASDNKATLQDCIHNMEYLPGSWVTTSWVVRYPSSMTELSRCYRPFNRSLVAVPWVCQKATTNVALPAKDCYLTLRRYSQLDASLIHTLTWIQLWRRWFEPINNVCGQCYRLAS